jgi:hypothetical protein
VAAVLRVILFVVLSCCNISSASELTDAEALELGYRVSAINEALQNPGAPGALQAITDLGHDQRYYVMVRGWLMYQLQGDMSILQASQGQVPEAIRVRIDFIQQAIRAIDLE